jgi:Ca2+-binding EF-hand superfamily protein
LRDKILSRLTNIDHPEDEIKELFMDIDENGSGSLSRAEFQVFLHDLDITFSRRRWDQIFKEIDKNFDDEISLEELFLFIFPGHDNARVSCCCLCA